MATPLDPKRDDASGWARQLGIVGHVGAMFPVAIGLGFIGGYWLDNLLNTAPWLALLGFSFGVIAAIRNLVRSLATLESAEQSAANDRSDYD